MPNQSKPSSDPLIFDLSGERLRLRAAGLEPAAFAAVPVLVVAGWAAGGVWVAALVGASAVPVLAALWGVEVGGGLAVLLGGALVLHRLVLAPAEAPFALLAGAAFVAAARSAGSWRSAVEGAHYAARLRAADLERGIAEARQDLAEARRRAMGLRERVGRLGKHTEMVREIEGSLEMSEVARTVARRSREVAGRGRVIVYRRRPDESSEALATFPDEAIDLDGEDLNPIVYAWRSNLVVPDLEREFRVRPRRPPARPYRSVAIAPLLAGAEVWGCLRLECDEAGALDRDDLRLLSAVAVPATLALENADLYTKAEALARRDGLTGLLRRHVFDASLEAECRRSTRYKTPLSLVMLDIDRFKAMNDDLGHAAGDAVLAAVGAVIAGRVAVPGTAYRWGGEEFAVLLPDAPKDRARGVAEEIRRAVAEVSVAEVPRRITLSAGVATYPADGGTPAALVEAADFALYRAKQSGRDRVEAV